MAAWCFYDDFPHLYLTPCFITAVWCQKTHMALQKYLLLENYDICCSKVRQRSWLMLHHISKISIGSFSIPLQYGTGICYIKSQVLPDPISIRVNNTLFASPLLSIKKREKNLEDHEKEKCPQSGREWEGVSCPHHALSDSLSSPNPFFRPECTDGADRERRTATMLQSESSTHSYIEHGGERESGRWAIQSMVQPFTYT